MKIKNAIKKVVSMTGSEPTIIDGKYFVDYKGYSISFFQNGRDSENITCIYTIRDGQKDDSMTDYYAGTFHDNLTQAFDFIDRAAAYTAERAGTATPPAIEPTPEPAADPAWTVRLTPAAFAATRERIEKINTRAQKRGFTGRLDLAFDRVEYTENNRFGLDVTVVYYETRITGVAPCINGWRFIARVDVLPNSDTFTLATAPDAPFIDHSIIKINTCEHCDSRRYRKNIYLVQNVETGEIKHVGSTCIKDFLGWAGSFSFLSVQDVAAELDELTRGGHWEPTYNVATVLAAAYLAVREFGWVSGKEANERDDRVATKSNVWEILVPSQVPNRESDKQRELRYRFENLRSLVGEATAQVPAMLEWISTLDDSSTFNQNLKAIASVDEVTRKQIGLLAYVPEGFARVARKEVEREARTQATNEFIGSIGDKVELTGTIKNVQTIPSAYGETTLYTIQTEQGFVKWFASSSVLGKDAGGVVTIRGTVKKHDTFRDMKSTVLTRCKEIAAAGVAAQGAE